MAPNSDLSAEDAAALNELRGGERQVTGLDQLTLTVYFALLMLLEHLVGQRQWLRWDLLPSEMMNVVLRRLVPTAGERDDVVRSMEGNRLISNEVIEAPGFENSVRFRRLLPATVDGLPDEPDKELFASFYAEALQAALGDGTLKGLRHMSLHPSVPEPAPKMRTDHFKSCYLGEAVEGVAADTWLVFVTVCHIRKALQEKKSSDGVSLNVLEELIGGDVKTHLEALSGAMFCIQQDGEALLWPRPHATVNARSGPYKTPFTKEQILKALANQDRYAGLFAGEPTVPTTLLVGGVVRYSSRDSVAFFTWLRFANDILIKSGETGGVTEASALSMGYEVNLDPDRIYDRLERWEGRATKTWESGNGYTGKRISVLPGAKVLAKWSGFRAKINQAKILEILMQDPTYGTKVSAYKRKLDRKTLEDTLEERNNPPAPAPKPEPKPEPKRLAFGTQSISGLFVFDCVQRACVMLESIDAGVPGALFLAFQKMVDPDATRSDFPSRWKLQGATERMVEGRKTWWVPPTATMEGPDEDWTPLDDSQIQEVLRSWEPYKDLDFADYNALAGSSKSSAPSKGSSEALVANPEPAADKATEQRVLRIETSSTHALMDALVRANAMLEALGHTTGVDGHAMVPIGRLIEPDMDAARILYRYGKRELLVSHAIHKRRQERKLAANVDVQGPAFKPVSDAQILEVLKAHDRYGKLDFSSLEDKKPTPTDEQKAEAPTPTPEAPAPMPTPVGVDAVEAYVQDQVRSYLDAAGINDPDAVKDHSGPIRDEVIELVAMRSGEVAVAMMAELQKAKRREELEAEKRRLLAEHEAKLAKLEEELAQL